MRVLGPFALVNLKPDTEYTTKILARNRAGSSEFTEPIIVRTMPTVITNSAPPTRFEGIFRQPLVYIAAAVLAAEL